MFNHVQKHEPLQKTAQPEALQKLFFTTLQPAASQKADSRPEIASSAAEGYPEGPAAASRGTAGAAQVQPEQSHRGSDMPPAAAPRKATSRASQT